MTDAWTPERIERELALCEAATPGPWRAGIEGNDRIYGPDSTPHAGPIAIRAMTKRFIASSRTGYPDALREIQKQAAEIERLQKEFGALLETLRAVGLALGLPDPWDESIPDEQGKAAWSGLLSEKIKRLQARVAELERDCADKATAWDAISEKNERIQRRDELLRQSALELDEAANILRGQRLHGSAGLFSAAAAKIRAVLEVRAELEDGSNG